MRSGIHPVTLKEWSKQVDVDYFPIFLNLNDEPCLVVGAGPVAARKVALLCRSGAAVQHQPNRHLQSAEGVVHVIDGRDKARRQI